MRKRNKEAPRQFYDYSIATGLDIIMIAKYGSALRRFQSYYRLFRRHLGLMRSAYFALRLAF